MRMNLQAFQELLNLGDGHIRKKDTRCRRAITPHERSCITLRFLAIFKTVLFKYFIRQYPAILLLYEINHYYYHILVIMRRLGLLFRHAACITSWKKSKTMATKADNQRYAVKHSFIVTFSTNVCLGRHLLLYFHDVMHFSYVTIYKIQQLLKRLQVHPHVIRKCCIASQFTE
jgi:hypothetical protein